MNNLLLKNPSTTLTGDEKSAGKKFGLQKNHLDRVCSFFFQLRNHLDRSPMNQIFKHLAVIEESQTCFFVSRLLGCIGSHTVDASEIQRSPPGMVLKPYEYWDNLPTSILGYNLNRNYIRPQSKGPFSSQPGVSCSRSVLRIPFLPPPK